MGDHNPVYTLDEALTKVRFGSFQVLALFFSGIGYFSDAMEISLLSFIGPALKSEWSLSPTQESLITTAVFGGMFCGAFFWGFISDTHGRKIGIQSVALLVFGAGLLSSFSPDYTSLVLLRLLLGFGASGSHVFISWFLEFIPKSNRGAWMLGMSASWIFGELLEASLAWIIMPRLGWRWLLVVSSVPSLVVLFLSTFAPESPRYLFMKSRIHEATIVLEKVAAINKKELPLGTLVSEQQKVLPDAESSPSEETHLLSPESKTSTLERCLETLRQLLSPDLLSTTLLLWTLDFAYTFIYYGIQLMISSLSTGQSDCGSSSSTLTNSLLTDDSLYANTLIACLAELPGLLFAVFLVDRFGRKLCMEILSLLTVISILPLLSTQSGTTTALLLISARMFMSAAFNTLIIYAEEVYPTSVRATGTGLMSAMGRFGGMVCPLVAVGLVRGCHLTLAVILFAIAIVISGVCVLFFPFETKGRELTDVVSKTDESD